MNNADQIRFMPGYKKYYLLGIFYLFCVTGFSQNQKFDFNGYLSGMQTVMFEEWDENWLTENQFHNRLNFKYYANDKWTFDLEVRNQFIYGEFVKYIPDYASILNADLGWMDLSWLIFDQPSFLLRTTIDRVWIDYTSGNFQARVGRQRINWGKNLVWNPNDIFNAYSYFDFDYVERPGSDAIRLQYYTGASSSIDLAVKIDSSNSITAAGRYVFSVFNYDIQFLTGIFDDTDLVLGTGWAGNIKGMAFRGEVSWFHSLNDSHNEEIMLSVSADYTFQNSIFISGEFLYSNIDYNYYDFAEFYFLPLNVKNIVFTDYNLMASISYPFTPLFTGSFAAMYYPSENGFYLGPTFEYSILENFSLSFILQYFEAKFSGGDKSKLTFGFLRLKWNF